MGRSSVFLITRYNKSGKKKGGKGKKVTSSRHLAHVFRVEFDELFDLEPNIYLFRLNDDNIIYSDFEEFKKWTHILNMKPFDEWIKEGFFNFFYDELKTFPIIENFFDNPEKFKIKSYLDVDAFYHLYDNKFKIFQEIKKGKKIEKDSLSYISSNVLKLDNDTNHLLEMMYSIHPYQLFVKYGEDKIWEGLQKWMYDILTNIKEWWKDYKINWDLSVAVFHGDEGSAHFHIVCPTINKDGERVSLLKKDLKDLREAYTKYLNDNELYYVDPSPKMRRLSNNESKKVLRLGIKNQEMQSLVRLEHTVFYEIIRAKIFENFLKAINFDLSILDEKEKQQILTEVRKLFKIKILIQWNIVKEIKEKYPSLYQKMLAKHNIRYRLKKDEKDIEHFDSHKFLSDVNDEEEVEKIIEDYRKGMDIEQKVDLLQTAGMKEVLRKVREEEMEKMKKQEKEQQEE